MSLKKSTLDVRAVDGLAEHIDSRSLPLGNAAQAVNLVADKNGYLSKRLGYSPLNSNALYTVDDFSFFEGFTLDSYAGAPQAIGVGFWESTNAIVTALESYMDPVSAMVVRGNVPEMTLRQDEIIGESPGSASSVTSCYYNVSNSVDYLVTVWISTYAVSGSAVSSVWWMVTSPATGSTIVPASQLSSSGITAATFVRLALVGNTFVCCYSDESSGNLWVRTLVVSNLLFEAIWTPEANILSGSSLGSNGAFDMRAVTGDSSNFVIAYSVSNTYEVVLAQIAAASPTVVINDVVAPSGLSSGNTVAFGIRADSSISNRVSVAFANLVGGQKYTIWAWNINYATFATAANPISVYTALSTDERSPRFVEVAYCGQAGQLSGNPTWTVSHSPWSNAWNWGLQYIGSVESPNAANFGALKPSNNSCIVSNQYHGNFWQSISDIERM